MRVVDKEKQKRVFLRDASALLNIYWFIRYSRHAAELRRHYRKAEKEKGRLAALGHDTEAIRLYRLWCKRPKCEKRLERFEQFFEEPRQMPLF
jgi:hypothetical protein